MFRTISKCDCSEITVGPRRGNSWQGTRLRSAEGGNSWGRAQCSSCRCDTKMSELLARVFRTNCHQCDCPEKLCAQDLSIAGVQKLRRVIASLKWQRLLALHGVFRTNCHQCDCSEKLWVQDVEIAGGELRREGGNSWGRAA